MAFETLPSISMPMPLMTSTVSGCISPQSMPALVTSKWSESNRFSNASAIGLCTPFVAHKNRTLILFMIRLPDGNAHDLRKYFSRNVLGCRREVKNHPLPEESVMVSRHGCSDA